jgi:nitrite reductase/ring-hydroxylating ferredoxin subunit/uncharacterized membrane protein
MASRLLQRLVPTEDGPLAGPAKGLQAAIDRALPTGGLRDALHGTWLGHPLHPALTDVPLGAWTAAVVLDGVACLRPGRGVNRAADLATAVGVVGALGAAASGAADWSRAGPTGRATGLLHASLNGVVTLCFATSLAVRRRSARRVLRLAGYGVGATAAWLGGHLVYRERLGVDHAERPDPSDRFSRALPLAELPEGRPVRAAVEGVAVVLVRQGDEIHALGDTCSHLAGPLSEGSLHAGAIRCPWHGSEFSLADGSVRHGPATMPQPCWEAQVRDGWVELRPATENAA